MGKLFGFMQLCPTYPEWGTSRSGLLLGTGRKAQIRDSQVVGIIGKAGQPADWLTKLISPRLAKGSLISF